MNVVDYPVFECFNITTSYDDWLPTNKQAVDYFFTDPFSHPEIVSVEYDQVCEKFAKLQTAYMKGPVARFHKQMYIATTSLVDTQEDLFAFVKTGPLYYLFLETVFDTTAEKTVESKYTDPKTFTPSYGLWYPRKTQYRVRYGILETRS